MSWEEEVVRTMFQIELVTHIVASGTIRGVCRSVRSAFSLWTMSLGAPAFRVRSCLTETLHSSVGITSAFDTESSSSVLYTLEPWQEGCHQL